MARRRMYGSQHGADLDRAHHARVDALMLEGVLQREGVHAPWRACRCGRPVARSMPPAAADMPRKMLPPPTTTAMSTPRPWATLMYEATSAVVVGVDAAVGPTPAAGGRRPPEPGRSA